MPSITRTAILGGGESYKGLDTVKDVRLNY
jgi:hypothetical protein